MEQRSWGSAEVVEGWMRGAEARNEAMRPATERMFGEAGVVPGARVLDIGTGTGDTAVLASARVGSEGSVVAIDSSPSMVEAAAAVTAGLGNVTVRQMDASSLQLELDEGSFDAAIGRQVLMFVDLPKTLAGVRRVLRAGGRFATVVWGPVQDNAFHEAIIASGQGGWGKAVPEVVRAFSLGDADAYCRAFTEAGFVDVAAHRVVHERRFETLTAALDAVRESPLLSAPLATSKEPERAWADFEARLRPFERNGTCVFPATYLVLRGAK